MSTVHQEGERATYDVRQTAKLLGIGVNQAYQACHNGTIPSIRIGNRFLIPAWYIRSLKEGNPGSETGRD